MSTVWTPRPINAETRPCRNNQNCHFLKNGHCWYYHPPHHHAHNQRMNNHPVPMPAENRNNVVNSFNPFASNENNGGHYTTSSVNVFDSHRPPNRNNHGNGLSRNARRRRNQRQNRSNSTTPRNRSPTNIAPSTNTTRAAPVIESPSSKRKRPDTDVTSPPNSLSDGKHEITIEAFQCPISVEIMTDPVVAADGHSYDRICIEQWLRHNNRSPMNNTILQNKKLIPNYTLKKCILEWNNIKPTLLPVI